MLKREVVEREMKLATRTLAPMAGEQTPADLKGRRDGKEVHRASSLSVFIDNKVYRTRNLNSLSSLPRTFSQPPQNSLSVCLTSLDRSSKN